MSDDRSIELSIEVPGSPEEVWAAIATGPGISSWYVPHTVEEREGGSASARFGPGPEMEIPGRVASWNPPRQVVFDGGEEEAGFAFEWTVEARGNGTCIVRLVNSGFGSGEEWDDQYDAMSDGWAMFLLNLRLHLTHFRGETAQPTLPTAMWSTDQQTAWAHLTSALGIDPSPTVGSSVRVDGDAPGLVGRVVGVTPWRLSLLLEEPARGTAFVAAESMGGQTAVSVWTYLYGEEGAEAARRDEPAWVEWLEANAP